MKLTLNEKRQTKALTRNQEIVTITHPVTKDFKGLDAQVRDEDKVVNFNISDCKPKHK